MFPFSLRYFANVPLFPQTPGRPSIKVLFLAKRGRRPRVAGFIILSLKGLRRDEISCGVYGHVYLFLGKRGRRPRVAGFIPREARPKASRSGVYNFVPQRAQAGWNLVWSLRSYISVRLVYAGNDVTRPCAGGLMVWGAEKLRSEGRGFESCKVFFFSSFFFSFFFVSNPEHFLEPFLFFVFLFGLK